MKSEIVKQGHTLRKAGIYARTQGEYVIAIDVRSNEWIAIHKAEAIPASRRDLERYYAQVPRDPEEEEQKIAYRAAEVRATWDERLEQKRRQSNAFLGKRSYA